MFSGIVQDIGTVRSVQKETGLRLGIGTKMNLDGMKEGASIACSGCCLTVIQMEKNLFFVDVSQETLSKTVIGRWQEGTQVNLEPSLRLGDALDGHFVYGHIDGQVEVEQVDLDGESRRLTLSLPENLATFIVPKGSVALDGVSLTINEVEDRRFGVNLIPFTRARTTLELARPGDVLNIEVDMLARYAVRTLQRKVS
jgi:riboflavin synthase